MGLLAAGLIGLVLGLRGKPWTFVLTWSVPVAVLGALATMAKRTPIGRDPFVSLAVLAAITFPIFLGAYVWGRSRGRRRVDPVEAVQVDTAMGGPADGDRRRIESGAPETGGAGAARGSVLIAVFGDNVAFATPEERRAVERGILILIDHVLVDASIVGPDVDATIAASLARIDRQLTRQIDDILHAPCFQRLEAAWRGLRYLVDHVETDALHKIQVLDVTKDELRRDLDGRPEGETFLFRAVHDDRYRTARGEPLACLVGDFEFAHRLEDVRLLGAIGKVAAVAHIPFIAAASPNLFGTDRWAAFEPDQDLAALFGASDHAAWMELRRQRDAAYLALCMPRILARSPHRSNDIAVQGFAYEETVEPDVNETYLWMNAAFAMAVNMNRAQKTYGWCSRFCGIDSGGAVLDLPSRSIPGDAEAAPPPCPVEIAIGDRHHLCLAKSGVMPVISRRGSNRLAFLSADSLFKPRDADGSIHWKVIALENYSARLLRTVPTYRFAHYIKVIIRDHINNLGLSPRLNFSFGPIYDHMMSEQRNKDLPRHDDNDERSVFLRTLQEWLDQYIDNDIRHSTNAEQIRRPLASASIEFARHAKQPELREAKLSIYPNYQLCD